MGGEYHGGLNPEIIEKTSDVKPAEETSAPEPADETVLTDTRAESLSKVFRALVEREREEIAPFKPAIAALNAAVAKFHDAGITDVGLEYADFDCLRRHQLIKTSPGKSAAKVGYCLFHVFEARFLVRMHPDAVIDLHLENLCKPMKEIQYLDSENFWHTVSKISGVEKEEMFFRCDFKQESDQKDFINTILQSAATCAVAREIADACKARKRDTLKKLPASLLTK